MPLTYAYQFGFKFVQVASQVQSQTDTCSYFAHESPSDETNVVFLPLCTILCKSTVHIYTPDHTQKATWYKKVLVNIP